MKINIINKSQHALPNYETIASAGMDLRANLTERNITAFRTVVKQVF
jgi:dUTP pyrophosphatase